MTWHLNPSSGGSAVERTKERSFVRIASLSDIVIHFFLLRKKVRIFGSSNSSTAKMSAPSPIPAGITKDQAFNMAQTEMEYRVELFNKLAQTCFSKCVDKRYKESDLNMGENSCIDRCVSKYWQVNGMVGQLLSVGKPPQ
ncbi:unnamed protein product [Eruca vesicaria subsp. sativa]|uniref:Mitochondrial import inner membrane translocase subunit n=1 Tax=Eruca vesicaria subsp. sativa TaxID=29727 RepID=A0ABC8M239_ERUVS|nr:unnamed protein product [Eruca vesicaria subsp. sativa]